MEEKERSLREIIAVRPWFTIRYSHRHAARESVGKHRFRREAVCRGRERRTTDLCRGDQASAGARREATEAGEGSAGRVSGMVVGDGRDEPLSRIAQVPRSVQDEVKVRLSPDVQRSLYKLSCITPKPPRLFSWTPWRRPMLRVKYASSTCMRVGLRI